MLLICTGSPLRPSTQCPSHWFSWLQTREQIMDMGLFSNSISPASFKFPSLNALIIIGIGVWIGQPCIHIGFLQFRQRFASLITCTAIAYSPFLFRPFLRQTGFLVFISLFLNYDFILHLLYAVYKLS